MDRVYVVTGAYGHLGFTVIKLLLKKKRKIRALVMYDDHTHDKFFEHNKIEIIRGDICDKLMLERLFIFDKKYEIIVIHTAGIVSIQSKYDKHIYDVNVVGTKNITDICIKKNVKRLLYVSSVHAIPEAENNGIISEIEKFDPKKVVGLYAKTKAEATQYVLDSTKKGLDAVVVQPSGIMGPNDFGKGHLTQLAIDYASGKLTAVINGGYDFVDVRDVARGIILAIEDGICGECYILSNRYFTLKELMEIFHKFCTRNKLKTVLPMWFAKITAPFAEIYYRLLRQPPLYTKYSLYTLSGNGYFSHQKATEQIGFKNRSMEYTIYDTLMFLKNIGRIKDSKIRKKR